jgi:ribosomal protein S8
MKRRQQVSDLFLKYGPKGEKVITNIARVSRPGCRVYVSKADIPRSLAVLESTSYDIAWCHDRQRSAQAGIRRRASVQHLLRKGAGYVAYRKETYSLPDKVKVDIKAGTVVVTGPKGTVSNLSSGNPVRREG